MRADRPALFRELSDAGKAEAACEPDRHQLAAEARAQPKELSRQARECRIDREHSPASRSGSLSSGTSFSSQSGRAAALSSAAVSSSSGPGFALETAAEGSAPLASSSVNAAASSAGAAATKVPLLRGHRPRWQSKLAELRCKRLCGLTGGEVLLRCSCPGLSASAGARTLRRPVRRPRSQTPQHRSRNSGESPSTTQSVEGSRRRADVMLGTAPRRRPPGIAWPTGCRPAHRRATESRSVGWRPRLSAWCMSAHDANALSVGHALCSL